MSGAMKSVTTAAAPSTWRLGLRPALLAVGAASTLVVWFAATTIGDHGDLVAYWSASLEDLYGGPVGGAGYYAYSPAFAQLFSLLARLPFEIVVWIWAAAMLAALAFCAREWTPLAIIAPPVLVELMVGNIHLLLAAAIVLGFRYPAAWAFVLLTKITPGVGLLWFVVRREWRSLAIVLGATLGVAGLSFALAPALWFDWLDALLRAAAGDVALFHPNASIGVPLLFRLPVAVAVVAWGAWTDRRWTVPIAAMLALPVLWTTGLSMLVALPVLARSGGR